MVKKKVRKRIARRKRFVQTFPSKKFSASGRNFGATGHHALRDPIRMKKKR